MPHPKQTFLLIFIITLATLLWGGDCRAADPVEVSQAIKVPLTTTAIPDGVVYMPSWSMFMMMMRNFVLQENGPTVIWSFVPDGNRTTTLGIGGTEYTVIDKTKIPDTERDYSSVPGKLLLKSPAREFTIDLADFDYINSKSIELTLDCGRKYFLRASGSSKRRVIDDVTKKKRMETSGSFSPGGVQTGKLPPPFQTPITILDINVDGFYTTGEDGIIVGPADPQGDYVQPFSKYISTPPPNNAIFEIQNLTKDGSEITLLPYRGPTASLEVVMPQGYSSNQITLTSDAGLNVTVQVKAGEGEGGEETSGLVTVIPGSYTILNATISVPPKDAKSRRSGLAVFGDGMPGLKVEAGTKKVLVLSGPKTLEFQATLVKGNITIASETIHFKGQAGETYAGQYYEDKPEVYLNVDGKSTLLGKLYWARALYGVGFSGFSEKVPADIDLKNAKEATVALKVQTRDFGELSTTVPLK
ncbi:MAG: hypothetical protein FWD53_08865 [Phycisphaerales bacterium]|nr:hypothetical protein [Phycisphaerales bacterium]